MISSQSAKAWTWTSWVLLYTLLILCGLMILWAAGWQFDRAAYTDYQSEFFLTLNRTLNLLPAWVWANLTLLGDASVLLLLLSPLILWHPQAWAAVLAAVPVGALLSVTGKHMTGVPRPAAVLDHQLFTIIGEVLRARNSFPSGHSLTIAAGMVAVLVALAPHRFNGRYGLLLLGGGMVAFMGCLSRVAVGAHWPLDAAGGALCGLVAGLSGAAIAERYQGWWRLSLDSITRRVLGVAIAAASLFLIKRILDEPSCAMILGLSAGCGLVASLGLMRGHLTRWHGAITNLQK